MTDRVLKSSNRVSAQWPRNVPRALYSKQFISYLHEMRIVDNVVKNNIGNDTIESSVKSFQKYSCEYASIASNTPEVGAQEVSLILDPDEEDARHLDALHRFHF